MANLTLFEATEIEQKSSLFWTADGTFAHAVHTPGALTAAKPRFRSVLTVTPLCALVHQRGHEMKNQVAQGIYFM